MAKNKLQKFAEMREMPNVVQAADFQDLAQGNHRLYGTWGADFFGNDNPITLELGCGKGEYAVGLAQKNGNRNFIGIDIKGARMHTGALRALALGVKNIAFLRTHIEFLGKIFAPDEVDELWITFPDPQMQKPRKRLPGAYMLERYSGFLKPGATIHLKTDSNFLYLYMCGLLKINRLVPLVMTDDLYGEDANSCEAAVSELIGAARSIQTAYERKWLDYGQSIKYIAFAAPYLGMPLLHPDEDSLPKDTYHSVGRGVKEF